MNAFITGSHAYGTPHEDSDIDLVVMMDVDTMNTLADLSGQEDFVKYGGTGSPCAQLKFGSLNLLIVTSQADYDVWKNGTAELMARDTVTRDEAVALFKLRRQEARGVHQLDWPSDSEEHPGFDMTPIGDFEF